MRALITGAGGFVGPHLRTHLEQHGDVVASVLRPPAEHSDLPNSYHLDLLDEAAVAHMLSDFKPDVIYHLAGLSFVPEAEDHFDRALDLNVLLTQVLLKHMAACVPSARLVYISSAEVYGLLTADVLPVKETHTLQPRNNYSLSKAMGELVVKRFEHCIDTVVIRPFNHIGPGQNSRFVTASFAQQIASIALGLAPNSIRVGNLDSKRDFTDVRDIVRGYRLAAVRGKGILNLCSGSPVSIKQILETLLSIAGVTVDVTQDPERMRPSENPVICGCNQRAAEQLSWSPEFSLRESLQSVYDYWLVQEESRLKKKLRKKTA